MTTDTNSLPAPDSDERHEQLERRARHFWVTVIVGLLSLQIAIGVTSILLAVSDPSVAIVPDYHQAALDWDVTHRSRQLTQRLGWRVDVTVGQYVDEVQRRTFQIAITDREGRPVGGLNVSAKVYHHARGAELYQVPLVEMDQGMYESMISLRQPGLWQVETRIEGDQGIASDSRQIEVE